MPKEGHHASAIDECLMSARIPISLPGLRPDSCHAGKLHEYLKMPSGSLSRNRGNELIM